MSLQPPLPMTDGGDPAAMRERARRLEHRAPGAVDLSVLRVSPGGPMEILDSLAVEEPMETRLIYRSGGQRRRKTVAITMRTPGNDVELALGFLFGEGIISGRSDFRVASHFGPISDSGARNIVHVELCDHVEVDLQGLERNFYTTSSCGVCGKSSIDALDGPTCSRPRDGVPCVDPGLIHRLPNDLRRAQAVFASTGGLHAAALFDTRGRLQCLREDVGRHNAMDKLIGRLLLEDHLPADQYLLVLSGRSSFELMQKAARAGIPIVVAIGAPSSLAVQLARRHGITLIGFARGERFNIYSAPTRINV